MKLQDGETYENKEYSYEAGVVIFHCKADTLEKARKMKDTFLRISGQELLKDHRKEL